MSEVQNKFLQDSEKKAFDLAHRATIKKNISQYEKNFNKGKLQYKNLDLAKKRVASAKFKAINELDKYLAEFEANFTARGGKIIWAPTAEDAITEIIALLRKYDAKTVVKSKSMITEELELNEHLEEAGMEVLETDLGEFIVQVAHEKPYHIITPVMHKSKEDVAALFNEKFGTDANATPEQITAFVRKLLRNKFTAADVGITGANFIIADIGGIALTENEGNALMSISFPQIHIAIAGIDKMIPSVKDLDNIWPLLATHGTGQRVTVYNSIITGPRQEYETEGPSEMYVVIVDNGRSELLRHTEQRRAATCIRCGACLNFCPIYKNIGGHAYRTTYSGPIGSVITPHLRGMAEYKHLSFSSSLCGRCTEVCPVSIPLHELLLYNRRDSVKRGYSAGIDKFIQYVFKKVFLSRKLMDFGNVKLKNFALNKVVSKYWGPRRDLPVLKPKSFNKLWKEQRGMEG
ncbi:MAG: Lactate utilization protein B [Bacteroidetes bacterium ADurb.Bin408]|nr:MAG: Lactate utilization protein B [Bacteroidetes bacterium ADurb.Bin408]